MAFDRKAWNRAWMQKERQRRRAVGMCPKCGEPREGVKKAWCLKCRIQHAGYVKRLYWERKKRAGAA